MNIHNLPLMAALLVASLTTAAVPLLVQAQASAPAAATGPRLQSPAEKRGSADAVSAPDLRPDRPVVPQISVPLGRTPPAPTPSASKPRSGAAAPPGHIGDAAARCESMPGDQERASCRKQLSRMKASPG
ncbi:MAG: hypothetical protein ABI887_03105 [Burkholderiales bacterium]